MAALRSPVWFDIDQTNVLNYLIAKENRDEKHICPLQLDVIERCIPALDKPPATWCWPAALASALKGTWRWD